MYVTAQSAHEMGPVIATSHLGTQGLTARPNQEGAGGPTEAHWGTLSASITSSLPDSFISKEKMTTASDPA
jgi:hypothetical protein